MKVLMPANGPIVPFGDLIPGSVFMECGYADPLMVITDEDEVPTHAYNAVELKTGELRSFGDMVKVVKVNAVLHVNC